MEASLQPDDIRRLLTTIPGRDTHYLAQLGHKPLVTPTTLMAPYRDRIGFKKRLIPNIPVVGRGLSSLYSTSAGPD